MPWYTANKSLGMKTLAPFVAALDGIAESSSLYLKHYVPFVTQSPLLTQAAIYTSASYLHATGHMDEVMTMGHKTRAIAALNERMWSGAGFTDETVACFTHLVLNEWYFGPETDLSPHLRGLREMIRLKGGLQTLGMHGLIAKLAVTYVSTSA